MHLQSEPLRRGLRRSVAHFRALEIPFFGEIREDRALGIRFVLVREIAGNVLQVYGTFAPEKP